MTTSSGLPARRVRLYGRETDAAGIRELLATAPGRLVTIVGPGGCGKTTLALEVAHQAVPAFADEGYWASLETCRDAGSVAEMVAAVVPGSGTSPRLEERLSNTLRSQQALLVVDNCEHVLPGVVPLVDALLSDCPDLRVLATSRSPLRVRGEHVHPLEPLPAPNPASAIGVGELERLPSVALFLDRSRAAGGRRPRGARELRDVATICWRLDGLPLAIELAAAQTLVFSPAQIAERLDARPGLPAPTGGSAHGRHQTMQATLDWSYSLLCPEDQALFELTSVFAGPWTLEALEALANGECDVAEGLTRLVESSLVATTEGAERRFRLLAPVREYALQHAVGRGIVTEARARHARHYTERARALTAGQGRRPLHPDEDAAIRADYENIVAAMERATEAGEKELALRLAQSLWTYWRVSGQAQLGLERCRALLRSLARADDRAFCHEIIANFLQILGKHEEAVEQAERGIEIFRESDNVVGLTLCLGTLGELASETGDYARAREHFNEALSMQPEHRIWTRAIFLADWGIAEYRAGDLDRAGELLRDADAMLRTLPEMWYGGLVDVRRGCIARDRGDLAAAVSLIADGIVALDRSGANSEVAHGLEELAGVECARERLARAVCLLAAAGRLREAADTPIAPADAGSVERSLAAVRRALREEEFTSAWVRGRAFSRPGAIAFALDEDALASEPVSPLVELTPREREVAALVAQGLTNQQIAERLFISEATARTHVERIRTKLGVHSRVSIARALMGEQR